MRMIFPKGYDDVIQRHINIRFVTKSFNKNKVAKLRTRTLVWRDNKIGRSLSQKESSIEFYIGILFLLKTMMLYYQRFLVKKKVHHKAYLDDTSE